MAAGSTYTPIATTTLGSDVASYTFSSIPSTYTDIILVANTLAAANNNDLGIRFNSDTGSNYSWTALFSNADEVSGAIQSTRGSNTNYIASKTNIGSTDISATIVQINNYANTSTYKTSITRSGRASGTVSSVVGLWRSTSAINSITISTFGGSSINLKTGSTFTLYGITSA